MLSFAPGAKLCHNFTHHTVSCVSFCFTNACRLLPHTPCRMPAGELAWVCMQSICQHTPPPPASVLLPYPVCSLTRPHLKLVPLPAATPSSSPAVPWQRLELPVPMVQAALSMEVANRLQLQRLRVVKQPAAAAAAGAAGNGPQSAGAADEVTELVQEVSVARLQALLTHR